MTIFGRVRVTKMSGREVQTKKRNTPKCVLIQPIFGLKTLRQVFPVLVGSSDELDIKFARSER